jgi:hypothetical protein
VVLPRPTIVVKTIDEDSSSGTGEEFPLANKDNFADEDDEDEDEEDPERTTVPQARQRAVGRAAAAQAEDNARSNKDTDVEANRRALKVGAGGQARKPAGPRVEETVGVQGHRGGAPYGVEEAIWARGGGRLEDYASEVNRGQEEAAHVAATATKTHRRAHVGGGTRSPQVLPELFGAPTGKKNRGEDRAEALPNFYWAPKHQRSRLVRPEVEPPQRPTAWPMPVGGKGAPKCCWSCLGCRVAEKPRGEDRAEALLIFYWAPKRRRSQLVRPEEK